MLKGLKRMLSPKMEKLNKQYPIIKRINNSFNETTVIDETARLIEIKRDLYIPLAIHYC